MPLPNMVKMAKPQASAAHRSGVGGKPELPEFHPAVQARWKPPQTGVAGHASAGSHSSGGGKAARNVLGEKAIEPPKLKPSQTPGMLTSGPWCHSVPHPLCRSKLRKCRWAKPEAGSRFRRA